MVAFEIAQSEIAINRNQLAIRLSRAQRERRNPFDSPNVENLVERFESLSPDLPSLSTPQ